jgi:hypothetical protein
LRKAAFYKKFKVLKSALVTPLGLFLYLLSCHHRV